MKVLTAHKESFDRKVVVVTKEQTVTISEWIDAEGEVPAGSKIVETRKNRFGREQVLCVWETIEPAEWKVFRNKASAAKFIKAQGRGLEDRGN